jgi:regulator of sigma E protease
MTWLVVVIGLMLIVFVHELGHFGTALAVGMRPRSFYLGFPPAVFKVKRRGIEYGIGAIPLGGFVRIPGMYRPSGGDLEALTASAVQEEPSLQPAVLAARRHLDVEDFEGARTHLDELERSMGDATLSAGARRSAERALRDAQDGAAPDAYWRQRTWKRIAVIGAGPAANILLAIVILTIVYATGAPSSQPSNEVAAVTSKTPAAAAGLLAGDRVIAVNGTKAATFDTVSQLIRASNGRPITVTVDRNGRDIVLGPRNTIRLDGRWIWGFEPATQLVSHPLGRSVALAVSDTAHTITGTFSAFGSAFRSHSHAQFTGTVGIVRISNAALKIGFNWYLQVVALVSIGLGLVNLLPLLPLDGGHILFSLIEAVRRRAVAREVYERVSVIGFALILVIFIIATQHDIGAKYPG